MCRCMYCKVSLETSRSYRDAIEELHNLRIRQFKEFCLIWPILVPSQHMAMTQQQVSKLLQQYMPIKVLPLCTMPTCVVWKLSQWHDDPIQSRRHHIHLFSALDFGQGYFPRAHLPSLTAVRASVHLEGVVQLAGEWTHSRLLPFRLGFVASSFSPTHF